LSPLDVIALEAALDPSRTLEELSRERLLFCPQAHGGMYRPDECLPGCTICRDLLIQKGGRA